MIERRVVSPRATVETVLLTFKEAMEFLRVSRSTIYRLMWSGQLRGHKVGSTWRFYESDLLAAVANPLAVREAQQEDDSFCGSDASIPSLSGQDGAKAEVYRLEGQDE
ncbi:MAG TPA: helix-turn-helix domain-containing protein [Ktedonobacterales bacterium]